MKKALALFLAVAMLGLLSTGCATYYPVGVGYTKTNLPIATGPVKGKWSKKGTAESKQVLALIVQGDSSIEAACKSAGITEIVYVDWEVENVLGIIATYRTVVYGN